MDVFGCRGFTRVRGDGFSSGSMHVNDFGEALLIFLRFCLSYVKRIKKGTIFEEISMLIASPTMKGYEFIAKGFNPVTFVIAKSY